MANFVASPRHPDRPCDLICSGIAAESRQLRRPYLSRIMRASCAFSHAFSFSRESIVRCKCSTSGGSLLTGPRIQRRGLTCGYHNWALRFRSSQRALCIRRPRHAVAVGFLRRSCSIGPAFLCLFSEISGAFGHRPAPKVEIILGATLEPTTVNAAHIFKTERTCRPS